MESRTIKAGAEDERNAASGMPGFDPPPITSALGTHYSGAEVSAINFYQVSNFEGLEKSIGYCLNDARNLSRNTTSNNSRNPSGQGQVVATDSLKFLTNNKPLQSPSLFNTNTSPITVDSQKLPLRKTRQSIFGSVPSINLGIRGEETTMADASPRTDISTDVDTDDKNNQRFDIEQYDRGQSAVNAFSDSSDRSKDNKDQRTLRRLAQNREAARKSRLRKKAYVQLLESSRLKLTQLEQELQKARQQGVFISSSGDQSHSMSGNGALAFDVEYARWVEEQNKQTNELRSAVNSHAGDTELRIVVDNIVGHYDEIFKLKSNAAKADVFHLLSGMWTTPAERCFLWLGGFRSSELLKLMVNQLEPLTEQQVMGINNLQQSSQEAEDALSQGMEALQQSLAQTLSSGSPASPGSSGNVANYMGQMAMAMGKLGTLEGFIRQADNLRQQTLQQMHRILTTRQSARAILAIHDYFSRLRALSSLWLARPRE